MPKKYKLFPLSSRLPLFFLAMLGGCQSVPVVDSKSANDSISVSSTSVSNSNTVISESELANDEINTASRSPVLNNKTTEKDDINSPPAVTTDFWETLRPGFSLKYSNPSDPVISHFESWYSNRPQYFQRLADRAYWYMPYIFEQTKARGMPAEIVLLPAIESAYRPDAVSRSKAVGMWQFMSATGDRFGLRQNWWVEERRDLVKSTHAALDYLEFLSHEFDNDWELVFAAYNAGEGTIRRAVKRNQSQNMSANYPDLKLRKETREYVPKLLAVRNIILNPNKYGITLRSIPNEQTLAVVDVQLQTDLTIAASLTPLTTEQLKQFNQSYKRDVTPPNGPHQIVLPVEHKEILLTKLSKLSHKQRLRWARHQVKKGEYLGRIAEKHGVTVNSIKQVNQLSSNLIKPGQELKIPISMGNYKYAKTSISDIKIENGNKIYLVKKGDSLWKISQANGISLPSILRWNDISKKTVLFPGQQLIVGKSS